MQEKGENFTKIIDRLSQFLEVEGDNFSKLANNIGLSNSYFSKMIKNNGSLGEEIIRKILLYYEKINAEWLILGVGSMLKEKPVLTQSPDKYVSELLHAICKLSEENGYIKAERKHLKEEIKLLRDENEQLKIKLR